MPRPPESSIQSRFHEPAGRESTALVAAGFIRNKRSLCTKRDYAYHAIVFVLEGGGFYEDERIGYVPVNGGDAILIFPGQVHSYGAVGDGLWNEAFLSFQGRIFNELEASGLVSRLRPILSPGTEPVEMLQEIIADFRRSDAPDAPRFVARVHMLLAWMVELDAEEGHRAGHDFATRARSLLNRDLSNEADLVEVASTLNLSYERFRKRFTQEVGVPPARYRVLRRVDRAKRLLIETEQSVKEIAYALGYCDPYFFSRQFKQVTRQSPSDFRRSI